MRVAIECAGFTPGEADQLRRAMATFKHTGGVSKFRDKLISGMVAHGYEREFAEKTFRQLEGFGSYGFPESHAASFALIAYASSWMKCWHPDVFCAALLNAQPMGFYAPAQIVRDARDHGVEVRPVCVNASRWDCTLEPTDTGRPLRGPARPAHGARSRQHRCRRHRRARGRTSPSSRSTISGAAPVFRPPRSCSSPRPMPSGHRWNSRGARRCGRSRRCATSRCRCSRPPQPAKPRPFRKFTSRRWRCGR